MKFEEAGRALDRELEKLRKFLRDEVRPKTKICSGVPAKGRRPNGEISRAIGKKKKLTLWPGLDEGGASRHGKPS